MASVISAALTPFLGRLYRLTANGVYCIISGLLCGFPIGAKTIAELYDKQKLFRTTHGIHQQLYARRGRS